MRAVYHPSDGSNVRWPGHFLVLAFATAVGGLRANYVVRQLMGHARDADNLESMWP